MRLSALSTIGIVALISCSSATDPRRLGNGTPPVFSFDYSSAIVPDAYQVPAPGLPGKILVGVRLANTSPAPARIEYGACSVAVWLYRDAVSTSRPVWENRLPANAACIAIAYVKDIAPGDSYQVGGALLGAATLGDSLPAGRYVVRVAVTHRETGLPASSARLVVLDAGTVELTR
jgi:hypothetical protein